MLGRHGGRSRWRKASAMTNRLGALRRFAKGRAFDVALAHGSHELTMTARRLGIPSSTTFDYEFAWLQHQLGCRAATKVVVPAAIPPERLAPYGAKPPKLLQYPGLKEEYYLARLRARPRRALAVGDRSSPRADRAAAAADVSLYHRHSNPLFPLTLQFLGSRDDVHAIVLPRTDEQREYVRRLALPSMILPERAIDAQSLIALADVVVSAGGTMNREGDGARRPRLHHLRRPPRRRRRGADSRRPPRAAQRSARDRRTQARLCRAPAYATGAAGTTRPAALGHGLNARSCGARPHARASAPGTVPRGLAVHAVGALANVWISQPRLFWTLLRRRAGRSGADSRPRTGDPVRGRARAASARCGSTPPRRAQSGCARRRRRARAHDRGLPRAPRSPPGSSSHRK